MMNEKKRQNDVLVLVVCSPRELDKRLLEQKKRKEQFRYVSLVLDDIRLLSRPFCFKKVSRRNLQDKLVAEVVESLGLPLDDVELGHQVLREDKMNVSGLLWGMSREALNEYLSVIDKHSLVPLEITAYAVSRLNGFIQKVGQKGGCALFVDFSDSGNAMVAVLDGGHCPLLRILPVKNFHQLEIEVGRSVRSAHAMDRGRSIDRAFVQGDSTYKEKMLASLKEQFDLDPEELNGSVHDDRTSGQAPHIKCNFAQNYSMSLNARKHLSMAVALLMSFLILLSLVESGLIVARQVEINTLKAELLSAVEEAGK